MYKLSKKSISKLEGVDENLVDVVKLAITLTKQDFSVICGIRTIDEQRILKAKGRTQTLKSKHITGRAVDLAAYNKGISWAIEDYYEIAEAIRYAANALGVKVRWGGYWLAPLTSTNATAERLIEIYINTRRSQSRVPFVDCPHFELY